MMMNTNTHTSHLASHRFIYTADIPIVVMQDAVYTECQQLLLSVMDPKLCLKLVFS